MYFFYNFYKKFLPSKVVKCVTTENLMGVLMLYMWLPLYMYAMWLFSFIFMVYYADKIFPVYSTSIYLPVGKFIQHLDQFIDEPATLWPTSVGHIPRYSGTTQHKVGLVRDHLRVSAIIRLNVTVHFNVNSCQNFIKC